MQPGGWHIVTRLPPVAEQVPDVAAWTNQQATHSQARLGLGAHTLDSLLHRLSRLQGPMSPSLLGTVRDLNFGLNSGLIKICQEGGQGVHARLRGPIRHPGLKRLN